MPEVLAQRPAGTGRNFACLATGNWATISLQRANTRKRSRSSATFFATLRDEIPATVFHIRLLEDMAECYRPPTRRKAPRTAVWKRSTLPSSPRRRSRASQARAKSAPQIAEKDPQLSVMYSTHNRKETLQLALAALSFQTLPTSCLRMLVIDDGSSDDTEAFCRAKTFPFGEIRYFHQANGAPAPRAAPV